MNVNMEGKPAFSHLKISLDSGESITAEAGSMASMSSKLDMVTKLNGNFLVAFARKFLGGETLFINHFVNREATRQELVLTRSSPGDIYCQELQAGQRLCMQPGAYLCSESSVSLGVQFAGFRSFLAREGLFKIVVQGPGKVWIGAYGALLEKQIDGEYIVDSSHLVAYEPQMRWRLQLVSGLFSSFFSGEGLVSRLEGQGKVVIQTRSLSGLRGWLNPKL